MSKEYEEKRGPCGADEHTEKRFPRERRAEERVPMRERDAEADGLIEGRNAVTEALRAGTLNGSLDCCRMRIKYNCISSCKHSHCIT